MRRIAAAGGFSPRSPFLERVRATLTAPGSLMTASMLRDIEFGQPGRTEAILGDLLRRAARADDPSLLRVAYAHVKAYEARRERGLVRFPQSTGAAPPSGSGA